MNTHTLRTLFCAAAMQAAAFLPCPAHSQGAPTPGPVDPAALARWQEARFGMFIHWGPVSQTGQEISWSRGKPNLPIEKYDHLYETFDPEKFNADEWVRIAKAGSLMPSAARVSLTSRVPSSRTSSSTAARALPATTTPPNKKSAR